MAACELSINNGTTEPRTELYTPRTFRQKCLSWELPVPEKCCCCLPLRHGFLVLAYIKLVESVALFLGIFYYLLLMFLVFGSKEILIQSIIWVAIFTDVVDIIMGILIIVSAYKKNIKLMEFYYRYSIYIIGLLTVLCSVIVHILFENIYALLVIILIFISILVMQVYLILMVRSKVLKLRSNAQFKFLNNEPEPLCTYTNNVDN